VTGGVEAKEFFLITTIGGTAPWVGFILFVLAMLAVDLGLFQRRTHLPSTQETLACSAVWVEKTLSVDNLFVFLVVFGYFSVPPALQHRVLFWGILGALVLRGFFIAAGAALLESFHWTIYVFGGCYF
jgi:tellurite resistance protein TerC